ncbi:uncharacterized protein LACBIDRAFT_305294 [Laccaria bicolor S238N-H82]|uniref:Predicted protein n=1 Tax=Laccaria bicolor (strain S238N-H82 / ATCC MYA-4686) TaxID=486041 RepID=B0CTW4_LACBS|nr:uncharacterized protein LACBIDRAFT_305294 [Laccaria bicolor S238N-H82]EDR14569.1 predicted protein [Laccaria bicolor S238N-H82]|eukprot:XP_001875128.1 predicted protein [Laccaria bicolor S238N-H82]
MTELSYAISDIQTRIFEIQELRHKSQSSGDNAGTTNIIDQSLMSLDERLESVEKGIKTINETLEPLMQTSATPTVSETVGSSENAALLRKQATLLAEWEAIQNESDVLREELKEDKWLTVFRTVTDQADGMMSSLEKAVNRCQEFIWQVHRKGVDEPITPASMTKEKAPITLEVFTSLLDSFEAKKKHYMPATSKVLSIIDKGVRDRVTKNGETLRRHAESAQKWKNLRERISRTDAEMETVRKILVHSDGASSEGGSSTSGATSGKNGYLATPPSGSRSSRAPSTASTLSRSISPFRKFARRITGSNRPSPSSSVSSVTPLSVNKKGKAPSSEPPLSASEMRRQKTSLFGSVRGSHPSTPITPDRPGHKHSQSFTSDSSPRVGRSDSSTVKQTRSASKQRWNSSTKVEPEERSNTIKATPPRRPPSSTGTYGFSDDIPPVPPLGTPYRRSMSRTSMASSRPWSPLTSSISTTQSSSQHVPLHIPNFGSRAPTPSRAITPSTTPRRRPKTPSHIPAPSRTLRSFSGTQSESGWDDEDSFQRSFSPAFSTSALSSTSPRGHPPRPPSRSMIPVPAVHLSSPSRPSTSMSSYSRSESPPMALKGSAIQAQTPESALRSRAPVSTRNTARPSINKLPPSSFKDGNASRAPSRPGSRAGAYTPSMDNLPFHEYVAGNPKDPLDAEVAMIVNSIAHGLLIERVDPPLKKIPKEGEEIKAQYAVSNSLSKKIVTCRLTTLTRSGKTGGDTTTKKVMCRVGGGWQDLSHYILNRQAGL